jgi:tetratricopeptide (TPR) repeat protein
MVQSSMTKVFIAAVAIVAAVILPSASPGQPRPKEAANSPDLVSPILRRGVTRLQNGDIRGAFRDLDSIVKADPRSVEGLFQRGNAQFKLGKQAEALADYGRALELDPARYEVLVARGHALLKQGDVKGAAEDFARARAINEETQHH